MGEETVTEQDDGPEDSEELPGGGDDGAGQGTELRHAHEDEELKRVFYLPPAESSISRRPVRERWPRRRWRGAR